MHISEGILSGPVLAVGAVFSMAGLALSLRRLRPEDIPKTAMFCAVFFVASLLRVPLGPGSAHLVLCGMMGAVLGWGAFVSIFVALLLQGVLFQFGGLTTLGINTFDMAAPAVLLASVLGGLLLGRSRIIAWLAAFGIGAGSLLLSACLTAVWLWLSGEQFLLLAQTLLLAHLPVAMVEGLVTAACVHFIRKVNPALFPNFHGRCHSIGLMPGRNGQDVF